MIKTVRGILIGIVAACLFTSMATADFHALAYWLWGNVPDVSSSVKADGRTVVLYQNDDALKNKNFVEGTISGTQFIFNGFNLWPLGVGSKYLVATTKGADDYGAEPIAVTIMDYGYTKIDGLLLSKGGGISDPGQPKVSEPGTSEIKLTNEATPEIEMWFGKRLYQKALVEKGQEFIVSKSPNISIKVKISTPYSLDSKEIDNYSIILDSGLSNSKQYSVKSTHISQKISAAAVPTAVSALTIDYPVPDELSEGKHSFTFSAKSSGLNGISQSSTNNAIVTIKSGPVSIIGEPLPFPSPYSPTKNPGGVYIQYTLSDNADIDIYIFSVSQKLVKKISCYSGQEGGSAGLNKVLWDGKMDTGPMIGNGIYVGTIVAKTQGKLLKKFKLNVFD